LGGNIAIAMADDQCRRALSEYLQFHGYEVRAAEATDSLLEMFHQWSPDVVICEHRPPRVDAIAVCRALRAVSLVPIVPVLHPEDEVHPAEVLNAGADACVAVPCDPDDLLSQVRALLRRAPPRQPETAPVVEVGDFRVAKDTHRCLVAGREVRLRSQPFGLLLYILRSGKCVFSHSELCRILWGAKHPQEPEFLRPVVMELRKNIEPDWHHPVYLLTDYGTGYRFIPFRN
jgi:DNA-binding response OmpR family regulator